MLSFIEELPLQLVNAWKLGTELPLSVSGVPNKIVISGMGGSAIGADLAASYVEPMLPIPLVVVRDYQLPAWAVGSDTLVIASSHSGNTEETLSIYRQALLQGCSTISISRGGRLAALAEAHQQPCWKFNHLGQPRSAVGWTFGLLLALFYRLGLMASAESEIFAAQSVMQKLQEVIRPVVPAEKNAAKQLAGLLFERWVCVSGSGFLAPVARRWKGQINELAKAWAQFEVLPEMDHNTLAGTQCPAQLLEKLVVLFITGGQEHARNQLRSSLTRQELKLRGIGTNVYQAMGQSIMEQMWSAVLFGDYLAYYLAFLYEVDPTPIVVMEKLKETLSQQEM